VESLIHRSGPELLLLLLVEQQLGPESDDFSTSILCAFDELLPDSSRLRTRIDDAYRPACLAEDVGGGYIGNMQNRVSSSITNGMKSPVALMMRPGLGPSRIHRCPGFSARTCEKSILAAVGITQASLLPELKTLF
jgi:hypothetical protein